MKTTLAILVAALLFHSHSLGQGSKADYERAKSIQGKYRRAYGNPLPQLHWLSKGQGLWYKSLNRREYRVVKVATGEDTTLFDSARLLDAINQSNHPRGSKGGLDVIKVELRSSSILLWLRGEAFLREVQLPAYTVKRIELKDFPKWRLDKIARANRSRRSSTRSQLLFLNDTKALMEISWIELSGRKKSYRKLKPGESFAISTFAGHVWSATNEKGREMGRWVAGAHAKWASLAQKLPSPKSRRPQPPAGISPNGKHRVFFRDHDLYLEVPGSKEETLLSDSGDKSDGFDGRVHWSPDSKYAIVFRTKRPQERQVSFVESAPKGQLQPKLHALNDRNPGDPLRESFPWLVDVKNDRVTEIDHTLFPTPYRIDRIRWQRDSKTVTFRYNERGHRVLRLIAVDSKTAKARIVVDESPKTFVDYAGKSFQKFVQKGKSLVWMSERSGWNHLYLVDVGKGTIRNAITQGEWVVRKVEEINEEKGLVYFWAGGINKNEDPYHLHFCSVELSGKNLQILTSGDGTHEIEKSPDGTLFIDSWSRVDAAPERTLRNLKDGKLIAKLDKASTKKLEAAGWIRPERFVAKGRDGKTDIWGVLFRPSNFDPQKKYPVIEAIYAGPHSAHVPKSFRSFHGQQRMAELGFLVVKIDGMGTSHRSKAFHDVCWKNLKDAGFPDRIAWIKALAQKEKAMDLTRVGIYGGSAGGQNAMRALIDHHDFYKVAVADCGCHDNRMDKIWWNELWMSYPIGPHYSASSNVDQAHRLEGKLLLIVGELDRNVDPASTMQVVDALIKADKDFDFLMIPGAGHGAAGSPYGRRRQADFFVRHLLGREPRSRP